MSMKSFALAKKRYVAPQTQREYLCAERAVLTDSETTGDIDPGEEDDWGEM